MKKLLVLFFLTIIFLSGFKTFSQDSIYRFKIIVYHGNKNILPSAWLKKPTNAKVKEADTINAIQDSITIGKALDKYPTKLLNRELMRIYLVGTIECYGVHYSGTNSFNSVYIANKGSREIEKTFHHEFSSILLRRHPGLFNQSKWESLSPEIVNKSSADAIKQGLYSVAGDSVLFQKGYLSDYSLSNVENDFNMYSENIFAGETSFWTLVDKYPKIKDKTTLVIEFYKAIDPILEENYFRFLVK